MSSDWLGRMLGLDSVQRIDHASVAFAAPWAQDRALVVAILAILAIVGSLWFYHSWQSLRSATWKTAMGFWRGAILAVLILTLADPVLRLTLSREQAPSLFLVVDGSESMAIEDEYPDDQRRALIASTKAEGTTAESKSRLDFTKSWLAGDGGAALAKLKEEKKVDVSLFVFEGQTTSQLRPAAPTTVADTVPLGKKFAEQLSATGQVTALGSALGELPRQPGSTNLAAVVLVSDFANNSGPSPIGDRAGFSVTRLGAPVYTIGVGAKEAIDLSVDLQADPKMKRAERTNFVIRVRSSGLQGKTAQLNVTARQLSREADDDVLPEQTIDTRTLDLTNDTQTIDVPYMPTNSGRFEFVATVEELPGEVVVANNRAVREVNIVDDYLRLFFAASEPTWEWRFVKEVFHRDRLVGMEGFRTFLGSSDPKVREANILFTSSLTPKRSEFFAHDVIFLSDLPRSSLNDRFCEMVKEYVGNLGGGLVVMADPNPASDRGLRAIHGTPLADMLPVVIDPNESIRTAPDIAEFDLRRTIHAPRHPFMQLGADDAENELAWANLGKLPWYQPVAAVHDQAVVLAEHPAPPGDARHRCRDGKTPQPIIAIRKYGKGEVVYLGFNEMWRLRKQFGEKYYRAFWSQLIYRLGMSHALGSDKRFVARLDKTSYRADEKVILTVEAYDENYEPLTENSLGATGLSAELILPATLGEASETRPVSVPLLRDGLFETRIPVSTVGEYALRVRDPVTKTYEEMRFDVANLSAERRQAVRNVDLQNAIAQASGGKSYDLTNAAKLFDDLAIKPRVEVQTRNLSLWTTPWWFGIVVALMLGEWFARKMLKLS